MKVDREERPDVDALYMEAVQGMTGRGGWPLNVFLTPEQIPFYGGTYFPPEPRGGMPAWTQVLQAIAESWEQNRDEIRAGGERVREQLAGAGRLRPSAQPIEKRALEQAVSALGDAYDPRNGGFGGAPKFPSASAIEFLLLRWRARDVAHEPARDGGRRHPRCPRRRLRPLQRRCGMDRAALREDALRQRAARARLPARLAGLGRRAAARGLRGHDRVGAAGDARARRAASTPRSTPTPRGSRAVTTYGRSASCASCWAPTPTARSRGSPRASRGTSSIRTTPRRGSTCCRTAARDPRPRSASGSASGCSPRASVACGPASTTSA